MNWETFNNMTLEQQTEYKYKFKPNNELNITGLLNAVSFWMFSIVILVFALFIAGMDKGIITEEELTGYIAAIASMMELLGPLVIAYILYSVASFWWNEKSKRAWMQTNNIIRKGKWWQK